VRAVLDGRSFVLTDGREVRLAGIETPEASKAALEKILGNRDVTLKKLGDDKDRHGRLPAFAFITGNQHSAQQILLESGHARVSARVGSVACAKPLLSAEQAARAAKLGLWSEPLTRRATRTIRPMCSASAAASRWSRARSSPCARAEAPST